jgi:Glutamate decarboxylase and related PLP-dependent proteins
MYTYELAPLATLIEQTIISRVGELIGFPQCAGSLTTGGSNGNMLGILCARQAMIPTSTQSGFDWQRNGCFCFRRSTLFCFDWQQMYLELVIAM